MLYNRGVNLFSFERLTGKLVVGRISHSKKERCSMAIVVAQGKCFGCALCVLTCPEDAMKIPPSFTVEIDKDKCTECRECLDFCPVDALTEV